MIATDYAGIWAGGLYVFFYTMVVIFAMVRSALAIPYSWLVRPRFIILEKWTVTLRLQRLQVPNDANPTVFWTAWLIR